uniref:site-specific DNA-methyltransferase (adenine-specific) n=1 Tax=viral metagenome TaxID=1070528 RepID=A0A6C0C0N0_9ZZZZ
MKVDYQGEKSNIIKPFLKWVGGKSQLMNTIVKYIPRKINNYHEIFLGGGSVLFTLLSLKKRKLIAISGRIFAYDYNKYLINTFNQLKINYELLTDKITEIINEFNSIEINTDGQRGAPKNINNETYKLTREHYYYWIRNKFNTTKKEDINTAAYFIFLNKTGFRGLYREGPNGLNIPYGLKDKKKIPKIIDKEHLKEISNMIQCVEFINLDFRDSIKRAAKGDFVYLDPPYLPETKKSFVKYNEKGFDKKSHEDLFVLIDFLERKKIKFIMNNSSVDLIVKKFKKYKIEEIVARRAIHSKNPGETTKEIIVSN